MSWERVPFESLYAIPSKNGLTRPARVRGSGYKMINMGELFAHDRIGAIDMELVPMNEKELETMLVDEGDLMFARQSLVLSGAGKCSIVKTVSEETTFESHIIRVRLKKDIAYPNFFFYYFKSPQCGIKSIVTQGVQAGIRGNDLKTLPVALPPMDEQIKIADILVQYDDLIENNRRRIQLLEESARLLYQEWFVHLRFPGHEQVKIIDGVPEGWQKQLLSELCVDIRETVKPDSIKPETPYIGLEHIPRRSITLSDWDSAEKVTSNKFRFQKSDIIFGKIRPYFHKVGFAICDGITSSDSIVIRALDNFYYQYLLMYLSSDYFVALASKTCKEGSKMPRADWNYLQSTDVLVPSDFLLEQFSEQINMIIGQLEVLARYNKSLAQARDLLLPKLMSGELTV
jgi:Restriction endonuclease S subunits